MAKSSGIGEDLYVDMRSYPVSRSFLVDRPSGWFLRLLWNPCCFNFGTGWAFLYCQSGLCVVKIETPFNRHRDVVRPEWIDRNGHMNVGFYDIAFDFATDKFLFWTGLDLEHRAKYGVTTMALEGHITYQHEVVEGSTLYFTTQLLDFDSKRIHYFHRMIHAEQGFVAATNELLSLHLNLNTRRATPMKDSVLERLAAISHAHASLRVPSEVGRVIGLSSKPTTR